MKKHIVSTSILFVVLVILIVFFHGSFGSLWKNLMGAARNAFLNSTTPSTGVVATSPNQFKGVSVYSNEFFIKLKKNTSPTSTDFKNINKKYGVTSFTQAVKPLATSNSSADVFLWYKVTLPYTKEALTLDGSRNDTNMTTQDKLGKLFRAIEDYKKLSGLSKIEPSLVYYQFNSPNDSYFTSSGSWGQPTDDLWNLKKINMPLAWDQSTGGNVLVADIDTGLDGANPDISGNVVPGFDFCTNLATGVTTDNDKVGHGTHTAGIIGATGNNTLGIVGINWKVKIMPLAIFDSNNHYCSGAGPTAVIYAADNGARVTNNSWGAISYDPLLDDAFRYAYDKGVISVAAAGNNNIDALAVSPASFPWVITVSATDYQDQRASFSNWGAKIDVAAPGVDILSLRASMTDFYNDGGSHFVPPYDFSTNYMRMSGTSMAAPHVTGLAALLLAKYPTLSVEGVRQIIRTNTLDLLPAGKDDSFGYGRIDAGSTMVNAITLPLEPVITSPKNDSAVVSGSVPILGGVVGPNFKSYSLDYGIGHSPSSWNNIVTSTNQITSGTLGTFSANTVPDGSYTIRLTATNTSGKTFEFAVYNVIVNNFTISIVNPVDYVSKTTAMPISGTVNAIAGVTLQSYIVEYAPGINPNSGWITIGTNTNTVVDRTLASWNTSALALGAYTIRVTATTSTGAGATQQFHVNVDPEMVPGWPKLLSYSCNVWYQCSMMPAFGDLLGNKQRELVTASKNILHAYKKDGSELPGFPVTLSSGEYFNRAITLDDLDGDGKKEIIVPVCPPAYPDGTAGDCHINIFTSSGASYPGWTKPKVQFTYYIYQGEALGPAIYDLDGDGNKEIVFYDHYGSLHAYKLNGTEISGFPVATAALFALKTSPGETPYVSIADMDQDGKPEIAMTVLNGVGGQLRVALLDNKGAVVPGWPVSIPISPNANPPVPSSAPTFADLLGDKNLEIVVPIGTYNMKAGGDYPIHAWAKDGSEVSGWPKSYHSDYFAGGIAGGVIAPVAADLDYDFRDNIIYNLNDHFFMYSQLGSVTDFADPWIQGNLTSRPVGNVNGDNHLDFIDAALSPWFGGKGTTGLGIVDDTGKVTWQRSFDCGDPTNPVTPCQYWLHVPGTVFDDMDINNKMEFSGNFGSNTEIFCESPTCWASNTPVNNPQGIMYQPNEPTRSYLWEMPMFYAPGVASMLPDCFNWPMAGHDPARTNRLKTTCKSNSADTTPPTVSMTSPVSGAVLTTNSSATLVAAASDDHRVSRVEFYYDSQYIGACTFGASCNTANSYTYNWNTTGVTGVHNLKLKAYDTSGNFAFSTLTSVTVQ